EFIIPAEKLATDIPGTVYVAFKKADADAKFVAASFTNVLKFTSKEIDPTTNEPEEGGYEDEYQVEDLELGGSDYVLPAYAGSFDNVWEQSAGSGEGDEASETLQLSGVKSISGASFSSFFVVSSICSRTQQRRSRRCRRRCPSSRSRAPTSRSRRRRTRSSCTARPSRAARSRRWCAWPSAARRASP
ncbi:MAG: hypothetical protein INR71_09235, partial [Terriglobus roseus]|nr:hypothetical protein [Terriglobus roseus]